ncbi:TIM barrel protein [Glutamicibacter sp. V16R2B1]|uniref:sugar phosphate isomerase/epimerase family protein n=1 Tax=Glutamicibacter sp. V16R2B1 TaxID=2036207 RepID=UPI001BB286A3|nr:TIM barrel protein [Glutamicibacter sp. V16R2B1]
MPSTVTPLGLAQLSLVGTPAPQLIRLAAEAGFDFIGARVRPVTSTERAFDLQPGSLLLAETLQAMNETGLNVRDVEFLLLDGTDQRSVWLEMMRAGQALGAGTLTVASAVAEENQLTDLLGQMTQDGAEFGIVPTLEVISYQKVNSLPQAARIAREAGCQIVADTLHLSRVQATPEQLYEHAALIPMMQLCDGPAAAPRDREGLVHESRSDRGAPGSGEFALASLVSALPPTMPLSVEAPSQAAVASIGEAAWVRQLLRGAQQVVREAAALRTATQLQH